MRKLNKLYFKIAVALVVGFMFAGAVTKITYTCEPEAGDTGCVSFAKAVMHPRDLVNNKQNSLTDFLGTFAISSLVSFALLTLYSQFRTKRL